MLPRRRPRPELLAVVAHHPDAGPVLGRVVPEVLDDLVDVMERDQVAKALLRAEDREQLPLVLGRVRTPEVLLGDRRRAEMGVVEDRPGVAAGDERRREVRLPDAFREPRAAWTPTEERLEFVAPSGRAGRRGRFRE